MREAFPEQYCPEHFRNVLRTFFYVLNWSLRGGISGPAREFSRLHITGASAIRHPIVLITLFLCSKDIFGSKTFSGQVFSPTGTVGLCSMMTTTTTAATTATTAAAAATTTSTTTGDDDDDDDGGDDGDDDSTD